MKIVEKSGIWVEPKTTSSAAEDEKKTMTVADLREAWMKAEAAVSRERNDILLRHEEIVRKSLEKAREEAQKKALEQEQMAARERQARFLHESAEKRSEDERAGDLDFLRERLRERAASLSRVAEGARREENWQEADRLLREMEALLHRMEQADDRVSPPKDETSPGQAHIWMG